MIYIIFIFSNKLINLYEIENNPPLTMVDFIKPPVPSVTNGYNIIVVP